MKTIAFVSCVKTKRPYPSPARELYASPLFKGMRRYAERNCDEWFILSAKYGALRPDEVVAPYELTLNTLSAPQRHEWADRVRAQLDRVLPREARIIILAGDRYRTELVPWLASKAYSVEIPMVGLPMGQQLKWLKEHSP